MRRERWKSGLVWLVLTLVVSAAIAFDGGSGFQSRTDAPPGHEPSECGTCRAHEGSRGPQLPYELGDDSVRFRYPETNTDEIRVCENDDD